MTEIRQGPTARVCTHVLFRGVHFNKVSVKRENAIPSTIITPFVVICYLYILSCISFSIPDIFASRFLGSYTFFVLIIYLVLVLRKQQVLS